jgi:hypothetical protein
MVALHDSNTTTGWVNATGGPLPADQAASIGRRFGLGSDHRVDELVATARVPVRWAVRWRELWTELAPLLRTINLAGDDVSLPMSAATLLCLVCEMSAARRVAIVDDVAAAVVVRSRSMASCRLVRSASAAHLARDWPPALAAHATVQVEPLEPHAYDVVHVDLRRTGRSGMRSALRAVTVTGLLVVAGFNQHWHAQLWRDVSHDVTADRYPEIEALTRDGSGTTCRLIGRPLVR